MNVFSNRRAYLRAVMAEKYGNSQSELADKLDISANLISRMLSEGPNRKNIGEKAARKYEQKLGLAMGSMDGTRDVSRVAEPPAPIYPLPSRDAAQVGREWEQLEPELRAQIQTLIHTLVARQKRQQRDGKRTNKPERRPAAS